MIFRRLVVAATAALLLTGCAAALPGQSAVAPEVRQSLAPTGKLRVGAYPGGPTSMVRDAATGETKGVAFELGNALARRLGVPFELVPFERAAQVFEALKAGTIDFTVTNASAERARYVDFTDPVLDIELGYIVMPGSPVARIDDVDRAGLRIGVTEGSSSQAELARQFTRASLVPAASLAVASEMVASRKVDAYTTNKPVLFEMADRIPTSRVLDGYSGLEHMAMGIPMGRAVGFAYLRQFAAETMAQGLVKRAADRAGLRGATAR